MALPNLDGLQMGDTFGGLLHTATHNFTDDTLHTVYDGNGNPSPLKISKDTISISDIVYPTSNPGLSLGFMVSNQSGTLTLSSWNDIQNVVSSQSSTTSESAPRGMQSFSNPGTFTFTVPTSVTNLKFIVTGGGGYSSVKSSGSGGTVVGFLAVTPGDIIQVTVGDSWKVSNGNGNYPGGDSYINDSTNVLIAKATGGNTTTLTSGNYGGGVGSVGGSSLLRGYTLIKGGNGGHAQVGIADRDSIGASSYWGSSPAYGGGSGCGLGNYNNVDQQNEPGGGVVVFEW